PYPWIEGCCRLASLVLLSLGQCAPIESGGQPRPGSGVRPGENVLVLERALASLRLRPHAVVRGGGSTVRRGGAAIGRLLSRGRERQRLVGRTGIARSSRLDGDL